MVEIGGRPILWHIMKIYARHGMSEFILCLGYRGNVIKEYLLNYEAMNNDFKICLGRQSHVQFMGAHPEQDFAVTPADIGLETMTGGRLQRIGRYLENDETFLLAYGDGLSDVNIRYLVELHASHGKVATV
jgi:glucose-1-phosphate cytidylyltransferase